MPSSRMRSGPDWLLPFLVSGGSEGGGMFGALIFIMVGVPGLALTLIAFVARKLSD